MSKTGRTPYRGRTTSRHLQQLRRVFLIQCLLTLLSLGLLYLSVGLVSAYSGLLGGLVYLLPTAYQLRHIFVPDNSNNIGQTLRGLYKSEIWKMALTATGFAVVFSTVKPIEPFSLFGVFVLLQLTAWLAGIFMRSGPQNKTS